MYDTRWPRPGPAMAAVAAVLGLVAGVVLGSSSPGSAPKAAASASPDTVVEKTTRTLPDEFHTVILGSYDNRANAEARLREVRGLGVRDAGILERSEYQLSTAYAVYSGQFSTQEQARDHLRDLAGYGIPQGVGRFYKKVTRNA
jgi:SPOR domain